MFSYYIKLAVLSIRRNPILSLLMMSAIAVGIGAFMTMLTVYHIQSGNPDSVEGRCSVSSPARYLESGRTL